MLDNGIKLIYNWRHLNDMKITKKILPFSKNFWEDK